MADETGKLEPCPDCLNSEGYSPAAYWIGKRLQDLMWNMPSREQGRADYERITTFLAGRAPDSWGHDEIDLRAATRKLAQLAGVTDIRAWETCATCDGSGEVGNESQRTS